VQVPGRVGIVGSGMLGRAIAQALLDRQAVSPADLWLSNRSGRVDGLEAWHGVTVTADNQALADACETIVLAVPPANAGTIGIAAGDRLVISVMAGMTIADVQALTGAKHVVRAMSSPAAENGLAYSPWVAGPGVGETDRATVRLLFSACGLTDEIADEAQLDFFTAMTGPVPGFVAYLAACMVDAATAEGISDDVADRAVRQLFRASARVLVENPETPAGHVQQMIDYAGTTAAGLEAMRASPLAKAIADGLAAATEKARTIARS